MLGGNPLLQKDQNMINTIDRLWGWYYGSEAVGASGEGRSSGSSPEGLPDGRIVEGAVSLQTCCPVCEYGEGYSEPFIAPAYRVVACRCDTCGTAFRGCV